MPVPVLEWESSNLGVVPAATLLGCMTGLVDVVNARVAAFPGQALWEVASSELVAAAKYVVLKPTSVAISAGANPDMRYMVFGGVTPATAVITPMSASSTWLYAGIAPNAGVDTPDNAYNAAVPFNTGSWRSVLLTQTFTGIDGIQYFEYIGGIFLVWRAENLNSVNIRIVSSIAGECCTSLDDEDLYYMVHGSFGQWTANVDVTTTDGWIQNANVVTSSCATFYSADEITWTRAASIWGPRNTSANQGWKNNRSERFLLPVYCRSVSSAQTQMKLRQIAYGPAAIYGDTLSDLTGVLATKIGSRSDIADHGPWLTNFIVSC